MTSSSDGQHGPPSVTELNDEPRSERHVQDVNAKIEDDPLATHQNLQTETVSSSVESPIKSMVEDATQTNAHFPPQKVNEPLAISDASVSVPDGNGEEENASTAQQTQLQDALGDMSEGAVGTDSGNHTIVDAQDPTGGEGALQNGESVNARLSRHPDQGANTVSRPQTDETAQNVEEPPVSNVTNGELHPRQEPGPTQEQHTPTLPPATLASSELQPPPPVTPFTPSAITNMHHHAYVMMALALSNPQSAMSPPPTVTPSQVTLPPRYDVENGNEMFYSNDMSFPAQENPHATDESDLECFARLEFADSVFQITTYAVVIGRDQRAFEVARERERREQDYQRKVREHEQLGLPPPDPPINNRPPRFSKSYVSEEGGMLGPASDEGDNDDPSQPPRKRRKRSHAPSEHGEEAQPANDSNRQYVSHTPGAAAVDLQSLRPSLDHVAFIGIHSPGPDTATKTKAISREHLKIAFNKKDMVFEALPLHKNGFFRQDQHYCSVGVPVVLKCGDRIQIKDVEFQFLIPGVEKGKHGAEGRGSTRNKKDGGKEMSFDFEGSRSLAEMRETSEESLSELDDSLSEMSDLDRQMGVATEGSGAVEPEPEPYTDEMGVEDIEPDVDEEEEEEDDDDDDEDDGDVQMLDTSLQDSDSVPTQTPKKRGPGRPPKNGIMSKREQRLLKKQQQEMSKHAVPEAIPETVAIPEPPLKRKVGRPRKHPLPEDGGPEKRKYKPRKPREDGAEGSDAERKAKEKKDKKVRPKSPPLDLQIQDYTDEQLQKPNKNYGVLIDETLTAAPDGLTLKQIYKRICQRYPWFYFHTETKGWESSVRHNLIGNEAFKKDETTNLWSRVPGVELDAGKKRKPTSPDRHLAQLGYGHYPYGYNNGQPMLNNHQGVPTAPPPPHHAAYPMASYQSQHPTAAPPLVRPAQFGSSASPSGPPNPTPAPGAAPAQLPGYGLPLPPAKAPVGGQPPPGVYSSPYARPLPPPAIVPVKTEDDTLPQDAQHRQRTTPSAPAPNLIPHQPGPTPSQTPNHNTIPVGRTSEPPQPPKRVIDPPLLNAVVGLREGLLTNLKKARNPQADELVFSAINRSFGLKTKVSDNHKMEDICIKGINQVVQGYLKGRTPLPGQTSTPPPGANHADWAAAVEQWNAAPKIMDFKAFHRIMGFKKVTIQTLEPTLGVDVAEAIALSSIDRALGLLNTSVPAARKPLDKHGKEIPVTAIESGLIKSLRQLLLGLGYSAPGSDVGATPTQTPTPTPTPHTQPVAQPQATIQPSLHNQNQARPPAPQSQVQAQSQPILQPQATMQTHPQASVLNQSQNQNMPQGQL